MSKKGSTYVEDSNIGFYSSMSEHIDLRLIKGKKEVVYGLHERGHSPTLIYPRPKWVKIVHNEEGMHVEFYNMLWVGVGD